MNRPGALRCGGCGAALGPEPQEQREIDAELVLAGRTAATKAIRAMSYGDVLRWADTEEKLRHAAKARRYHHGWVRHEMSKRQGMSA